MADLRPDGLRRPHRDRFAASRPDYSVCMDAHERAVAAGQGGYIDPITGLFVMTAPHLASRPCCDRGCRHCPWVGGPS